MSPKSTTLLLNLFVVVVDLFLNIFCGCFVSFYGHFPSSIFFIFLDLLNVFLHLLVATLYLVTVIFSIFSLWLLSNSFSVYFILRHFLVFFYFFMVVFNLFLFILCLFLFHSSLITVLSLALNQQLHKDKQQLQGLVFSVKFY